MSESTKNGTSPVGDTSTGDKADRSKAESAKATAAKTAGGTARSASKTASGTAAKTGSAARDAKSSVAEAGKSVTSVGATLGEKAKAGGELLSAVPQKTVQAATTTWTVLKNRKAIAVGVGSGAVAMLAGAYALGGANVRRAQGPLTRATRGVL
ncbi:hypothetical protein GKQ77_00545 [Streptomyces sp. BG9H]|uniref:Lytic transglycosylase n=1 Tax=Streptomyces anatolicus TaxID=2675858 RepID=A0ABS6YF89_9ACTN|nr:hypothetical protein [Streptomyces anatolicus]MBW5420073.1 hypothetical protein [Streptomyces anatolicus]